MRPHDSRPSRAVFVALTLVTTALAVLGVAWANRGRGVEPPRWKASAFVPLGEAPGAPAAWRERWVVAVHPGCPHCAVSLASLAAARDGTHAEVRVTALLVDLESAPPADVVAALPADETWWDVDGRWRWRWAHRVYGEVLCFDPAGRLLRLMPALGSEAEAVRRLEATARNVAFD